MARIDELERIDAAGVHQRPVRRTLGTSAFGTNAYTAEPHTEEGNGHVVIAGAARFVVDGGEIDGQPGTLVFLHDPASRRFAEALRPPGAPGPG